MIVGLHGLKRTGKDTIADYLVAQHGFVKFAFADAVYAEIAQAFGVSEAQLRSHEWKTRPQPELALRNCRDPEFVRMLIAMELPNPDGGMFSTCNRLQSPYCTEIQTAPRTSAFITQRWATEYRRGQQGEDYWTNIVECQMAALPDYTKIVVSDVRFVNEAEVLERYTRRHPSLRSAIVQVVMPGTFHTGHVSDDTLPRHYIDHIITSMPGDLSGLYQQVEDFITRGIKWKQISKAA